VGQAAGLVCLCGIASAGTFGCSALTSFDGFSGGSADAGDAGGLHDAQGSSDVQGGSDVQSGGDVQNGSDVQAGDGPGDEASTANFCLTHAATATFCADFDEGSVRTGWLNGTQTTNLLVNKGAVLDINTSLSPPGSLQAVPMGAYKFADVEVDLTSGPFSQLHAELDVSPDNADAMSIVEIDFCNGTGCGNTPPYDFEILLNQNGSVCVGEHGMGCTASLTQPGGLPVQQWAHVTLDANLKTGAVTLTVGSISPIQGMLTLPGQLPAALFVFGVGLPSMTTGKVHVDNVLLTVQP
jgi:hypothetical protein